MKEGVEYNSSLNIINFVPVQSRLELVNFNRLLSFLPKPTLPKQEDSYINQEADNYHVDSWGEEDRIQYPAV